MSADKSVSDTRFAGGPVRIIADSPLLRSVDRSSLSDLASELEWVVSGEHEALFIEGVQDDALYFVADGRLQIIKTPDEGGSAAKEGAQVLGEITAGDVVPPVDLDVHAPSLDSPSGWRIALNRINPFIKSIEIPGIVAILQRAGQLANLHNRRQRIDEDIADLYLRPPVEQFKILDFSAVDETVKIGYSYGVTEIDAWKKHG